MTTEHILKVLNLAVDYLTATQLARYQEQYRSEFSYYEGEVTGDD